MQLNVAMHGDDQVYRNILIAARDDKKYLWRLNTFIDTDNERV